DPTAIDSGPVRRAVLAGCTQLRADLAAVPAGLGVPDRAEAENRAVERLVARVRALGHDALAHDVPVEQWLGDWEQIVAARRWAPSACGGRRSPSPGRPARRRGRSPGAASGRRRSGPSPPGCR